MVMSIMTTKLQRFRKLNRILERGMPMCGALGRTKMESLESQTRRMSLHPDQSTLKDKLPHRSAVEVITVPLLLSQVSST